MQKARVTVIKNIIENVNLFLFLMILLSFKTNAQEEISLPNYAPLSPEVANLARYTETPVNLYTGVPNISVPIYTIKTSNLEIPISLSYHAGGHKVEEIASWVGLGWSLNAGGVIYRQTRQLPDDSPVGYIRTQHTVEELNQACNTCNSSCNKCKITLLQQALGGEIDYEPDNFNFSFLGYSGNFYFNQDRTSENPYGELIQSPISDIKIDYLFKSDGSSQDGFFDKFILTTPDGNKFIFEASNGDFISSSETLSGEYLSGSLPQSPPISSQNNIPHNTSWKLSKIELISGEEIEFDYDNYPYSNKCTPINEWALTPPSTAEYGEHYSINLASGTNSRIKKITFNSGYIDFIAQNNFREDLLFDKALSEIKVFSKLTNTPNDLLVNHIKFDYTYFNSITAPIQNICLGNYDNDEVKKRLCLNEISFRGNYLNPTSNYKYSFEYNTQQNLPDRYSKAQDYWGYYNGKNTNNRLIPSMFVGISPGHADKFLFIKANREVDPDYSSANILTKINYPTGGYSEFVYENNERSLNADIYNDQNIFEPSFLIDNYNVSSNQELIVQNNKRYFRTHFSVPNSLSYRGLLTFWTNSTICSNVVGDGNGYGSLPIEGCDIRFHIKRRIVGGVNVTHPYGVPIGYGGSFYIEPGDYTLEIEINSNEIDLTGETISAGVEWRENRYPGKKMIGGVRVKEINDYQSGYSYHQEEGTGFLIPQENTSTTIKRRFEYLTNNNECSGWIKGVPIFFNVYSEQSSSNMSIFEKITSDSNSNAIMTHNNYVGYMVVREIKTDDNDELLQESSFTFQPNQSTRFNTPTYLDWHSGRLSKKRLFKKKENAGSLVFNQLDLNYDLLSETTFNSYYLNNLTQLYPASTGFLVNRIYYDLSSFLLSEDLQPYNILTSPDIYLKKQTTKDYFYQNNDVKEVSTNTEYFYDGIVENTQPAVPKHLNPIKIITTLGDVTSEQNLFYPKDLVNNTLFNSTIINQLISQNQINTPLLKEIWQNGEKTSTLVNHYKDWGTNALGKKVLLPELIQTAKGNQTPLPLETRLRYVNIDPLSTKTREVKQENGASVVYLWGYNKTLPVAKIENISYNSIPSNVRNAVENANDETSLLTALTALRNHASLANAMVTTYTYIPLVGIKTMTDPKGYTTTYHYDSFNRLEKVTDMQGNILSENQYHYRTQN